MSKIEKALDKARLERTEAAPSEPFAQDKLAKAFTKAAESGAMASSAGSPLSPPPLQAPPGGPADKPARRGTEILNLESDLLESNRIMTSLRDARVKDYYDLLRTQILQRTRDKGWNSIMVTSVGPGEGKTLTSINLALSMAQEARQTALLVGMNLRTSRLCTYLGLDEDRPGLSDYLLHDAPVPDLMFSPGQYKLTILPTGKPMSGSTDILGSPKMKSLVQELKSRYPDRYVIYDCPHILDMPDAQVFSSYVDAVVLVVAAGKTPKNDIRRAIRTLDEQGVNIIGLVMNKADHLLVN